MNHLKIHQSFQSLEPLPSHVVTNVTIPMDDVLEENEPSSKKRQYQTLQRLI